MIISERDIDETTSPTMAGVSPLRICLVSGTYPPARCGVGDYTERLAESLVDRGAEVSIVTSSYLGTQHSGANPTVLPVVNSWEIREGVKVLRHILRTRPQIVHFQFPTTEYHSHRLFDLLVPTVKLWPYSPKVVVTLHEPVVVNKSVIPGLFRPLRHWLSGVWSDALIVVDESYKDSFWGVSAGMRKVPCKVIPIASNIPVSKMQRDGLRKLREHEGISDGEVVLTYFGFIQPRKGFEQVLDILNILRNRGFAAKLIVVGELSDRNAYHREVIERINSAKLANSIKISGHLDPIAASNYLAMSDACILPFLDGVHPKRGSFLAAAQQGTFVVTTSTTKKGLSPDENVYYAAPGDVEEMAKAVQEFSGRRLPNRSPSVRTWQSVADEHFELFNLISRTSG